MNMLMKQNILIFAFFFPLPRLFVYVLLNLFVEIRRTLHLHPIKRAIVSPLSQTASCSTIKIDECRFNENGIAAMMTTANRKTR